MKQLKIGITAGASSENPLEILWASGISQNIAYLAFLLCRNSRVSNVYIVDVHGDGEANPIAEYCGLQTLSAERAAQELDIIIELGARGAPLQMEKFRRRGGRLVSYMAGNAMVMNFEALSNNASFGEIMSDVQYDAVWITPQHWHMNRSYCEVTRSSSVECAPHIWHPFCLMNAVFANGLNPFWRHSSRSTHRIGVFDPNINVIKTFHFPLLLCEQAYRARPDLLESVMLFGTQYLSENTHFREFCGYSNLGQSSRIFAEARHPLPKMMGAHVDAVVTHQWENDLNYMYWDVLYLGWPLIHNSERCKEVGYYYPSFDPVAGGAVLCEALETHASSRLFKRQLELEFLWGFNIDNPAVQMQYDELIERVL